MRVGLEVQQPGTLAILARHAADVDAPVDDVEDDLDPARAAGPATGGSDVDGVAARQGAVDAVVHGEEGPAPAMLARPDVVARATSLALRRRLRRGGLRGARLGGRGRLRALRGCLRLHLGLASTLPCLVGGQRFGRVDVGQRRVPGTTASQPDGRTPNRLVRIATSVLAFIGPMPGSPSSRASRSLPLVASRPDPARVVRRSRRRSRGTAPGPAPPWRPGSGGSPAASGTRRRAPRVGIAAIRAASRCPSRRWSSSGPLNAFWTVTCWSSSKPISSASGSLARSGPPPRRR